MDDLAQKLDGRIGHIVLDENRLEAAPAVHVSKLDVGRVEGNRPLALGDGRDLIRGYVDELRRRIETIPEDVIAALQRYEWLGNVRELENILQRAIIVSRNGVLTIGDAWVPPLEGK